VTFNYNEMSTKEPGFMKGNFKLIMVFLIPVYLCVGCKKLVQVPPPTNSVTVSQVFSSDAQATAAISGLYSYMINTPFGFSNSGMTFYSGLSADELTLFFLDQSDQNAQFRLNALDPANVMVYNNLWINAYSSIYRTNAIIEGLSTYSGVNDSLKSQLIGEARFIRAFCYFYLVNLFGEVPLVYTTNYHKTKLLSRSSVDDVYTKIMEDLKDADSRLHDDFNNGKGQRIVPSKYAVGALLSRVSLFRKDYSNAVLYASAIINKNDVFELEPTDNIFLKNSKEAIWQLQQDNSGLGVGFNATFEGFQFIPPDPGSYPFVTLATELMESFADGDLRKTWIDSGDFAGTRYYYPYKYKTGPVQAVPNGEYSEYYMVLRLAEQYLIRAEAFAYQNNLTAAISDINKIRQRAGLSPLSNSLSRGEVLDYIERERQIEFFAEWGHRWLDLKRWNKANSRLGPIKGVNWQAADQLYPIPQSEIQNDPNLTQNPGY
jgi:starch-binding outer membrane protein, SusD/RagB family